MLPSQQAYLAPSTTKSPALDIKRAHHCYKHSILVYSCIIYILGTQPTSKQLYQTIAPIL